MSKSVRSGHAGPKSTLLKHVPAAEPTRARSSRPATPHIITPSLAVTGGPIRATVRVTNKNQPVRKGKL